MKNYVNFRDIKLVKVDPKRILHETRDYRKRKKSKLGSRVAGIKKNRDWISRRKPRRR